MPFISLHAEYTGSGKYGNVKIKAVVICMGPYNILITSLLKHW